MRRLLTTVALFALGLPAVAAETAVNFVRDVRPILAKNCFGCHGPDEKKRQAGLRLDVESSAKAERKGRKAIVPGDPTASTLVRRIDSADADEKMPPADSGRALTQEQIDLLKQWVKQGAKWGQHWAFEKPVRPPLPVVKRADWAKGSIDRFVLARLEKEGLAPSPEADRSTLARRVALDLTGLPPEPALAKRFVEDTSPLAYERLVDDLLKSPAFGERWARVWLDLARYADTKGYEKDLARTMWRYRDWVIEAFNRDLPYDQFTREQLAGDLLPDPTTEQVLATAFHRNTMVNDEGGTDDEEFRVAAVKDRVDTTLQVWMGLTMGCAKCHSHKYDPISHGEYYQVYAYFNQTLDNDSTDEQPRLPTPTREQTAKLERLSTDIAAVREKLYIFDEDFKVAFAKWEEAAKTRAGWAVTTPTAVTAASGSKFKILDDKSVLVEARKPVRETYTITLPTGSTRVTGIRLEVLPDKTLPKQGVGRAENDGNFVLSRFVVKAKLKGGTAKELPLGYALADFQQELYPVEHAIKNPDPRKHGWAVAPQQGNIHSAVFGLVEPYEPAAGTELEITLDHQFEFTYPGFSIGRFRVYLTGDEAPSVTGELAPEVRARLLVPADRRSADEQTWLWGYYASLTPTKKPLRDRLESLNREYAAVPVPLTPVMRDLPYESRRPNRIHLRGSFLDQGDPVEAGVPAAFHPFPADAPKNRLGVAAWLTSADNPLTARVAVNRFWAQFFGTGLVETQEDFGSQGRPPSHPELLDWLAIEFRETGWSMKALCKTIVTSAIYRQSARVTPSLLARDRRNILLARGPRFRLEAETIRDQALAASGLLSHKMFGPSVMPPQPEGLWKSAYSGEKWVTATGEDRYRRGLYTFAKRTAPYPAATTLDAPSREICTVRRISTNTPLQALVTLNDTAFVEMAQALARAMLAEGKTTDERIAAGLRRALIRPAMAEEIAVLRALYETQRKHFEANLADASRLATEPLGPAPKGADLAELAALTAVANVILNLDEFLMRN